MKMLTLLLALALAAPIVPVWAAGMDGKRADLKESVNKDILKAKKQLTEFREEIREEGDDVKVEEQQAVDQVESRLSALESTLSAIDDASEDEWKSVKADVERSQKELRQAVDQAEDRI